MVGWCKQIKQPGYIIMSWFVLTNLDRLRNCISELNFRAHAKFTRMKGNEFEAGTTLTEKKCDDYNRQKVLHRNLKL